MNNLLNNEESACQESEFNGENKKCPDCDFCQHCPISRCSMCKPQVGKNKKKIEENEKP